MANVKNYGLKGVNADLQFGKSGGRLIYDTGSSFFKFTTDGSTLSNIRVATTPSDINDAASKSYVDATANGLDVKDSVRAATTAAGTLASDFANGDAIDGVTLATNDRILIKDQADGSENGIYTVNASGAPTRATDFDADAEVTAGAFTFVEEGTTNGDTGHVLSTNGSITVGSTSIAFTQFSGAGLLTAGTGLTKTGNTLDVIGGDGIVANANDMAIDLAADTALAFAGGKLDVTIDLSDSTNDVTGTLAIGNGGTGVTSLGNVTDAGSSRVTITGGTGAAIKAMTFDVNEGNLDLANVGGSLALASQVSGTLPIANGGTGGTSASGARTALGLAIGTDVQAYDADLDAISALAKTDGGIIVGDGSAFVLESGATARTSLGLGTGDTPTFNGAAMGAAAITGVADPSNAQDAATKAYVDTASSTIASTVAGGTGSGSVTFGSDTLTIAGTANEIETSFSGTTLTIGIPTNPTLSGNATITGNLTVQGSTNSVNSTQVNVQNAFVFEGASADAHETTLSIEDPTADRTITLPNATGQLVLRDSTDTLTNKTIAFGSNTFSGTLGLANGGTNKDLSSIAQGTILVGGASNDVTEVTIGSAHKILKSTGTTVSYVYQDALRDTTDGNVVIEADTANIADNTKLQIRNSSSNVEIIAIDPDDSNANIDLVLQSQGSGGRVRIKDSSGGAALVIGDDDTSLTVSGGAASASDAGDAVIKGGNGTGSHNSGDVQIKGGTGGASEGKVKITDSSDNEIALFEKAASAVNEYSFTNAATGANPTMAATGDDTNISVALTPKGNGLVVVPNGYESNVGSVDDALVTRRWVLDNVVSAVDDLIIRKAVADDGNSTNTIGTMPNAASTTYYVTRILINVTEAFSGGSFSSMKINDGTTDLAGVNDTDLGTVGSYIVDLDAATATAGGATLTLSYLQSNGSTASTPTAGACTVSVEYKAAQ
tara:strand:+ start:1723 stop:4572 length:2850 start_codon:yes stop_codon:yes gene_type:complete